ncbi:CIS tube protein [Teredinibacter turnerae]|uniref:CIS tube protein n=1 Tax=Teredinibacter turnerae TaxID=2426 RepID=UPI0003753935|nr:hypothetical protein [Teredinibacter turnerae]
MASSGVHEQLEITACSVNEDGSITVNESDSFTLMLNPQNYKRDQKIKFSNDKALGEVGNQKRFVAMDDDKFAFEAILDGTGVISDYALESVEDMISSLEAIVGYDGDTHEPKYSRIVWGTVVFYGRLESLSSQFTLFKPSGEPLRAKINMSFVRFMTDEEESKAANRSSPDLTHIVETKEGDTLPLLCYRIYRDSHYYTDIARINGIDNFRQLPAGTRLLFPPLS